MGKEIEFRMRLNPCSHGYFYHHNCDDAKIQEVFWFRCAELIYKQLLAPLGW